MDCSDDKINLVDAMEWDIQVTLGFDWIPKTKPEGKRLNVYICIDNLVNRNAVEGSKEDLQLVTSYDIVILSSKELSDGYTNYLYSTLLQDISSQAPIITFAAIHPTNSSFCEKLEFLIIDGYMASDFKTFTRNNLQHLRNTSRTPKRLTYSIPVSFNESNSSRIQNYDQLRKMAVLIEPRITFSLEFVIR